MTAAWCVKALFYKLTDNLELLWYTLQALASPRGVHKGPDQVDRGFRMSQISENWGLWAGSRKQRLMRSRRGWPSSGRGSLAPPHPTAPTTWSHASESAAVRQSEPLA